VAPTTTSNSKYNAVLAAITTSSPKDQATPVQTTTHFPNIPDFDTPYLLTLQDSKLQSNSKPASSSAANTNSRQSNSHLPKSRRVTLTTAFSLHEPSSTAVVKPTQSPRSRGSSRQISLDSSAQPAISRRGSKAVTLSAPLSGSFRSDSHSPNSSSSQDSNTQRTTTEYFTVADNKISTSKAVSLDAEISVIENSFTQNSIGQRHGNERGNDSSRTDLKALTKLQNQNQRGASEAVPRTRLVSDPTPTSSSNSTTSEEFTSSRGSAARSRNSQTRQSENIAPRYTTEPVTPHSISQSTSSGTVSSPSTRNSTSSQYNKAQNEWNPTPSPSTSRSSYQASLIETDDVNSGLSRNSVVQQTSVSTSNRARSRGSSQRTPTACADALDTNSNEGCNEKPQIRYNLIIFLSGKVSELHKDPKWRTRGFL
jgi:hypothetical protein